MGYYYVYMSRLSVADKHQMITSFANRHTRVEMEVKPIGPPGQFQLLIPQWSKGHNAALIGQSLTGRVEARVARFDASLGFDRSETMAGEPIVPILDAMASLCEDLVQGIESVAVAITAK